METKPKIYMICGISGSGKTRFSKEMELFGIPRISMDEELWPDFYVLADMISDEHRDHLYSEATKRIYAKVANFCAENRPCSVDMPFCKLAQRDAFRAHIEKTLKTAHGCSVEITQRDVYTVNNNLDKVKRYVKIIRESIENCWE